MNITGWIHVAAAVGALLAGAAVLLQRKGTRRHRRTGWAYVVSMLVLNATALMIYRLSGGFGPFHVAALFSLATVAGGTFSAVRRGPGWLERHYYFMTYSYAGLVAAAVAEVTTRTDQIQFWWAVVLASLAVMVVAGAVIERRKTDSIRPFQPRRPLAKP